MKTTTFVAKSCRTVINSLVALGLTAAAFGAPLTARPAFAADAPLPDLTVRLTASATEVDFIEKLTLTATVKNPGEQGAANIKLVIDLGQAKFIKDVTNNGERESFTCAPAAQQIVCQGGILEGGARFGGGEGGDATLKFELRAPAQAGDLPFKATVDPDQAIAERIEINNRATAEVQVKPLPDLAVQNVEGTDLLSGRDALGNVQFTLTNKGDAFARNAKLVLSRGGLPLRFKTLDFVGDASGFTCQVKDDAITCAGGDLGKGDSVTVRVDFESKLHLSKQQGDITIAASLPNGKERSVSNSVAKHRLVID